ncbi:hypothetical protein ES703_122569 [subsurface metagenome]
MSSTVPSLCPTDIIVRISSSLTRDRGTGVPPTILVKPEAIQLNTTTKGVNNQDITSIGRTNRRDNFSACRVAMVLGVVSQKMRRMMVIPMVATSTPHSCLQTETAKMVARTAAAVLTKVLPSKTMERNFSGRSIILATRLAPLTLASTICSTLNLCKEIKAVSELEKKADKRRQITSNAR